MLSRSIVLVLGLALAHVTPSSATWAQDTISANALLAAAEAGDADAQHQLARAYERGDGVEQDDFEAVRWLRRAAEQDHPAAALDLGWMLANGYGVPQDSVDAYRWFVRAATLGAEGAVAQRDALAGSIDPKTRARLDAEGLTDQPARTAEEKSPPARSPSLATESPSITGGTADGDPVLSANDTFETLRDRLNAGGGPEVLAKLMLLARDGDSLAQNLVGVALGRSENASVRRDGLDWLFRAARQGLPAARYNLASALMAGSADRPVDFDAARRWLNAATADLSRLDAGGAPGATGPGAGYEALAREFSARSGISDPYRAAIQGSAGAYRELRELIRLKHTELIARGEFLRRRSGVGGAPVGGVETTVIE